MSIDIRNELLAELDAAYNTADTAFHTGAVPKGSLSKRLQDALTDISSNAGRASAALTNIATSLTIKAARPSVDVRYHQAQIQSQTKNPAGFTFRNHSEDTIYPWLSERKFDGAKSGWQTRVYERPKPYMMDYDENIKFVKNSFLAVYDELEENGQNPKEALAYLIYLQIKNRESKNIKLAIPRTNDIDKIVSLFESHFFASYRGKGGSRLAVLGMFSVYKVMISEVGRYRGKELLPLKEHSAADEQTGAVGDIEISDGNGIFEALEIKHEIPISLKMAIDAEQKIMNKKVDRYYILTTHQKCSSDEDTINIIKRVQEMYGCQMICNGVMATLKYYLRLLVQPSAVFEHYVELLAIDKSVSHEHREAWNKISSGS